MNIDHVFGGLLAPSFWVLLIDACIILSYISIIDQFPLKEKRALNYTIKASAHVSTFFPDATFEALFINF